MANTNKTNAVLLILTENDGYTVAAALSNAAYAARDYARTDAGVGNDLGAYDEAVYLWCMAAYIQEKSGNHEDSKRLWGLANRTIGERNDVRDQMAMTNDQDDLFTEAD